MRRAIAALAVLLLVGGCSDDSSSGPDSPQDTDGDEAALTDLVLSAESVGSVAGFEGVTAQPLDDVQVFQNPDPRGPCGGPSPAPPLEGTAGRSFTGAGVSLVQVVAEGADVDEFVDAQIADIAEPCGPYESETDAETTQTVDQIQIASLPQDLGYFSTARIDTAGQTIFSGSVLVRIEGITSLVFVIATEPIPLATMESLTLLVDAELRAG